MENPLTALSVDRREMGLMKDPRKLQANAQSSRGFNQPGGYSP